jgi:hypothetical protein
MHHPAVKAKIAEKTFGEVSLKRNSLGLISAAGLHLPLCVAATRSPECKQRWQH